MTVRGGDPFQQAASEELQAKSPMPAPKKKAGKGHPKKHMQKAKQAMQSGDFHAAKVHLLNAANAAHAMANGGGTGDGC